MKLHKILFLIAIFPYVSLVWSQVATKNEAAPELQKDLKSLGPGTAEKPHGKPVIDFGELALAKFFPSTFKPSSNAIRKAELEINAEQTRIDEIKQLVAYSYRVRCPAGDDLRDRDQCFGSHSMGQRDAQTKYIGNYSKGATSHWGLGYDKDGVINLLLKDDGFDFGLRFRNDSATGRVQLAFLKSGVSEGFAFSNGPIDTSTRSYLRIYETVAIGAVGYGTHIDDAYHYVGQLRRLNSRGDRDTDGIGINIFNRDTGSKLIGYRKNDRALGKNTILQTDGSRSVVEYGAAGITYEVKYSSDGKVIAAGYITNGKLNGDLSRVSEFPFDFHVSIEMEVLNEIWVLNQRRKFAIQEYSNLVDTLAARASKIIASNEQETLGSDAPQGKRHALVIGNDSYANVQKLRNAVNDADAVASSLSKLGFQVAKYTDVAEKDFKEILRDFRRRVLEGDDVVIFYAGHGVQIENTNYLLPVDIRSSSGEQVRDDAIRVQRLLDDMLERKARFTLVILDSCRDNPFQSLGRSAGGRGLAPTAAASGQMIMFSAGSGQQALDRLGDDDKTKNGLFTRVLVSEIQKPGVSVDRVLRNVRNEVVRLAKTVGHLQTPALYDQALGDFYFKK